MSEAARLSKMLWEAREVAEMFADLVEHQRMRPDLSNRRLVEEIDAYRAEQGWSPNGFGGERDTDRVEILDMLLTRAMTERDHYSAEVRRLAGELEGYKRRWPM